MMNDKKFVEISGLPFNEMREQDIEDMTEVLSKLPDYEYDVLIIYADAENFDAGTPKQPSKLLRSFQKLLNRYFFPEKRLLVLLPG